MLKKRTKNITTERLFLTPNPKWKLHNSSSWFKNVPMGNEMAKWVKRNSEKIGIDSKKKKKTNNSLRSSIVSQLAKSGLGVKQLIKIT